MSYRSYFYKKKLTTWILGLIVSIKILFLIKIKVEIAITKKIILRLWMIRVIFRKRKRKGKKMTTSPMIIRHTTPTTHHHNRRRCHLEVSKKAEKLIKPRKMEKKITEKTEPWKKLIKPIKILKKSTGLVWFWFYKPETEKTEPNSNRKKLEKNRAKLKKPSQTGFCPKNRTKTGRFEPVLVRFQLKKKDFSLVTFFL